MFDEIDISAIMNYNSLDNKLKVLHDSACRRQSVLRHHLFLYKCIYRCIRFGIFVLNTAVAAICFIGTNKDYSMHTKNTLMVVAAVLALISGVLSGTDSAFGLDGKIETYKQMVFLYEDYKSKLVHSLECRPTESDDKYVKDVLEYYTKQVELIEKLLTV